MEALITVSIRPAAVAAKEEGTVGLTPHQIIRCVAPDGTGFVQQGNLQAPESGGRYDEIARHPHHAGSGLISAADSIWIPGG